MCVHSGRQSSSLCSSAQFKQTCFMRLTPTLGGARLSLISGSCTQPRGQLGPTRGWSISGLVQVCLWEWIRCVCVSFLKSLVCYSEPKKPSCQFSFSETSLRPPPPTHTAHLGDKVALFRPSLRHSVWSLVTFPHEVSVTETHYYVQVHMEVFRFDPFDP